MKTLVLQGCFAYVYLNKSFYRKELINSTLAVYGEFLKGSMKELGKYFVLKIVQIDKTYTLDTLAHEFMNYLLSEEYKAK